MSFAPEKPLRTLMMIDQADNKLSIQDFDRLQITESPAAWVLDCITEALEKQPTARAKLANICAAIKKDGLCFIDDHSRAYDQHDIRAFHKLVVVVRRRTDKEGWVVGPDDDYNGIWTTYYPDSGCSNPLYVNEIDQKLHLSRSSKKPSLLGEDIFMLKSTGVYCQDTTELLRQPQRDINVMLDAEVLSELCSRVGAKPAHSD